nr:MAG: RNA-dependent RNA polymerase [Mitovirus sp.]
MRATLVLFQNPRHILFMDIDPNRAQGCFVVLDPIDRSHLLYLSERAYLDYSRVALSNDSSLVVLSRPGDDVAGLQEQRRSSQGPSSSPDKTGKGSRVENSRSIPGSQSDMHNPSYVGHRSPLFYEELGVSEVALRNVYGLDIDRITTEDLKSFVRDFLDVNPLTRVKTLVQKATGWFSRWRIPLSSDRETGLLVGSERNLLLILRHWGSLLFVRMGFQLSSLSLRFSLLQISRHISLIARSQGTLSAILRMKVALHVIWGYLGGQRVLDTRHLGFPVQLSHGLPSFIPYRVRQAIRDGNIPTIRFVTSLLYSYRAIQAEWKTPSFDTIVNQPFVKPISHFTSSIPSFTRWLESFGVKVRFPDLNPETSPFSVKTGANYHVAPLSAAADLKAWISVPVNHVLNFIQGTGQVTLHRVWTEIVEEVSFRDLTRIYNRTHFRLGKLALKQEAAGKTRVFAITDWWTQCALRSLHDHLFQLLKSLPTDGTFDQDAAVDTFRVKYANTPLYSFDLSAATDNIPVVLSETILAYWLGPEQARLWKLLIVDREFDLPYKVPGKPLHYGRGQPIGTLSSWAILAITHHALVQLAAMQVGIFPYQGYRVLGDDIVISGTEVAEAYRAICSEYEIPINQKGFISLPETAVQGKSLFTFAAQICWGSNNLSPLSLKDELMINSLGQRVNALVKLVARGGFIDNVPSILTSIVRSSVGRLSYASGAFVKMSGGIIPDELRALVAALLYPTEDPDTKGVNPSGRLFRWDQAPPFWRTFSYLFDKGKALYGDPLRVTSNWSDKLLLTSPARKYWLGLLGVCEQTVQNFGRRLGDKIVENPPSDYFPVSMIPSLHRSAKVGVAELTDVNRPILHFLASTTFANPIDRAIGESLITGPMTELGRMLAPDEQEPHLTKGTAAEIAESYAHLVMLIGDYSGSIRYRLIYNDEYEPNDGQFAFYYDLLTEQLLEMSDKERRSNKQALTLELDSLAPAVWSTMSE